jgi:hypothetical protein
MNDPVTLHRIPRGSRTTPVPHAPRFVRAVAALLLPAWCYALTSCATWTPTQKSVFAVNVGCNAVDGWQTDAAMQDGYYEANPVYGNHPSTGRIAGTKATGMLLQAWALDSMFKQDNRMVPLLVVTAGCAAAVAHNYAKGVRP